MHSCLIVDLGEHVKIDEFSIQVGLRRRAAKPRNRHTGNNSTDPRNAKTQNWAGLRGMVSNLGSNLGSNLVES